MSKRILSPHVYQSELNREKQEHENQSIKLVDLVKQMIKMRKMILDGMQMLDRTVANVEKTSQANEKVWIDLDECRAYARAIKILIDENEIVLKEEISSGKIRTRSDANFGAKEKRTDLKVMERLIEQIAKRIRKYRERIAGLELRLQQRAQTLVELRQKADEMSNAQNRMHILYEHQRTQFIECSNQLKQINKEIKYLERMHPKNAETILKMKINVYVSFVMHCVDLLEKIQNITRRYKKDQQIRIQYRQETDRSRTMLAELQRMHMQQKLKINYYQSTLKGAEEKLRDEKDHGIHQSYKRLYTEITRNERQRRANTQRQGHLEELREKTMHKQRRIAFLHGNIQRIRRRRKVTHSIRCIQQSTENISNELVRRQRELALLTEQFRQASKFDQQLMNSQHDDELRCIELHRIKEAHDTIIRRVYHQISEWQERDFSFAVDLDRCQGIIATKTSKQALKATTVTDDEQQIDRAHADLRQRIPHMLKLLSTEMRRHGIAKEQDVNQQKYFERVLQKYHWINAIYTSASSRINRLRERHRSVSHHTKALLAEIRMFNDSEQIYRRKINRLQRQKLSTLHYVKFYHFLTRQQAEEMFQP